MLHPMQCGRVNSKDRKGEARAGDGSMGKRACSYAGGPEFESPIPV